MISKYASCVKCVWLCRFLGVLLLNSHILTRIVKTRENYSLYRCSKSTCNWFAVSFSGITRLYYRDQDKDFHLLPFDELWARWKIFILQPILTLFLWMWAQICTNGLKRYTKRCYRVTFCADVILCCRSVYPVYCMYA